MTDRQAVIFGLLAVLAIVVLGTLLIVMVNTAPVGLDMQLPTL